MKYRECEKKSQKKRDRAQIWGRIAKNWNWGNWKHGTFIRIPFSEIPEGGSLIEGRFAYTIKNKPIAAGRKKTGPYLDGNRKLDARFCVDGFRKFAEPNASALTVQLRSIRLRLAVISFRKWGFRAMDVPRAFLRSKHVRGELTSNYQEG